MLKRFVRHIAETRELIKQFEVSVSTLNTFLCVLPLEIREKKKKLPKIPNLSGKLVLRRLAIASVNRLRINSRKI